jgi:hypothetical protein
MDIELIDPVKDASRIVEGLMPDLREEALRDLITRTTSRDPALYVAAVNGAKVIGLVCFSPHRLSDRSQAIYWRFRLPEW